MTDASVCLAYLQAARVVHNLYVPDPSGFYPVQPESFEALLNGLADHIVTLKGSPDDLGCLASMLILDATYSSAHEDALKMMAKSVDHARGTDWEAEARVAHAMVRFFYVMRYGWIDPVLQYALGDKVEYAPMLQLGDELLDRPFVWREGDTIRIGNKDPLAAPSRWFSPPIHTLKNLVGLDRAALPKMTAQCGLYSSLPRKDETFRPYPSTLGVFTNRRVARAETLNSIALCEDERIWRSEYAVLATEHTLVRLLGYRSILRAYQIRTDGINKVCTRQLKAVELIIDSCAAGGETQLSPGRIWIVPVYDNPPLRLVGRDRWVPETAHSFTLTSDALMDTWEDSAHWGRTDLRHVVLDKFYSSHQDELALGMLLALHTASPLLTYDGHSVNIAKMMGIGCEYPGSPNPALAWTPRLA
jgi:hypothetical protein